MRAAREIVRLDRAAAFEGIDPQVRAATKKADALTVRQGIELYLEDIKPRIRTWDQNRNALMRTCKDWMDRPVKSIARAELLAIVDGHMRNGKTGSARASLALVKRAWKFLAARDYLEYSVFDPIPLPRSRPHQGFYTDDDIKRVWKASHFLPADQKAYVRLMILLAPRRTSLAQMRWEQIDKDISVWVVPPEQVKQVKGGTRVYTIPLPAMAQEILRKLGPKDKGVHRRR